MSRAEPAAQHDVTVLRPTGFEGLELTRTHTTLAAQPRHLHDEYQVGVIEKGWGAFHYRGERHTVFAGQIAVVQAQEAHSCFTNSHEGWSYSILYLTPSLFNNVSPENCNLAAYFSVLAFRNAALANAVLELFNCFEQPARRLEQETRLMRVLTELVGYCADTPLPTEPLGRERRAVRLAKAYLHENVSEDVTLSELAVVTGLSKFHLLRQFSNSFGITPHEYQTSLRIALAKTCLRQGEPLARVAAEAGFADQAHFTRTFKKLVGVTPGQYQTRASTNQRAVPR